MTGEKKKRLCTRIHNKGVNTVESAKFCRSMRRFKRNPQDKYKKCGGVTEIK